MKALFGWNKDATSNKLTIEDDMVTIRVTDGTGFKTSLGDTVF